MKAYHGTNLTSWQEIKRKGLLPREVSGKSNWVDTVESAEDRVYLTTAYPLYFALQSCEEDESTAVIIEVETDDLPGELVADEDALEQVARESFPLLGKNEMYQRTCQMAKRAVLLAEYGLGFDWSMNILGTGAHVGAIPLDCTSRVALIDIEQERHLCFQCSDAMITTMNYLLLGDYYRGVVSAIFGDLSAEISGIGGTMIMPPVGSGVTVLKRNDW